MVGAWGFEPETPTVSTRSGSPFLTTLTNLLRKNATACDASCSWICAKLRDICGTIYHERRTLAKPSTLARGVQSFQRVAP